MTSFSFSQSVFYPFAERYAISIKFSTMLSVPLFSLELLIPLPNNKILDWPRFKALAQDKINATEILKRVLGMVENNWGKGENANYQHFSFFPKCFRKPYSSWSLKVRIG